MWEDDDMTAPTARLEALEAEAFRSQRHQALVTARLDHITNAIGDLSQDGRALALDVREIKTEVAALRTEVQAGFEAVQASLAAIVARLDGPASTDA
jgi:hypothetical protein